MTSEDTQRGEAVWRRRTGCAWLAERLPWVTGPTDLAVTLAVVLVVVDGLMTLPAWHLEGNPVVLTLGAPGMMAVKLLVGAGLPLTYFLWVRGEWTEPYGTPFVWALTCLYTLVVGTNVLVVLA